MTSAASLNNLESPGKVFGPRRWRVGAAWIFVAVTALVGIPSAFALNDGAFFFFWIRLVGWIFVLPLPLYASGMARRVTVEPGVAIRSRTVFGIERVIPIDATTEIVHFSSVDGNIDKPIRGGKKTKRSKAKHSPIGVIDQKWAVIRSQGRTVIRLSMWTWRPGQLLELAMAAPAQLRLRPERTPVDLVKQQYPDYYAPIERHPAVEGWVLAITVTLAAIAILLDVGSVFSLAAALWPAPR